MIAPLRAVEPSLYSFLVVTLACLAMPLAIVSAAEQAVGEVRWSEQQKHGHLKGGKIEERRGEEPSELLVIDRAELPDNFIQLAQLDDPGVEWPGYLLRGKIRYENVDAPGFLEMWSYFPDGSYYFSRTLDDYGPMGKIEGTSSWRDVLLPFSMQAPGQTDPIPGPNKLVLNLVLPGGGKVELGSLEIVQIVDATTSGAWWSQEFAGVLGGGLGTLLGLSGAAVGIIGSFFGWSHSAVRVISTVWLVVGTLLLVVGGVAIVLKQPFAVYFPLLLCGLLATSIMGAVVPLVARQSRQIELRRMEALDVR